MTGNPFTRRISRLYVDDDVEQLETVTETDWRYRLPTSVEHQRLCGTQHQRVLTFLFTVLYVTSAGCNTAYCGCLHVDAP